jgi:hypothetical protein
MLVATDSFHNPTRVNVCDGMWSACGTDGAMSAYARRRWQRLFGERRDIVGVDDVVRQTRMVRHLLVQRLQDFRRRAGSARTTCRSAARSDRSRAPRRCALPYRFGLAAATASVAFSYATTRARWVAASALENRPATASM